MVISHYSLTAPRVSKPFNPLIGETFEMTGGLTWFVLAVIDPPKRMALRAALPDPNMTTKLLHAILYLNDDG